jgi:signal transduction histidine kinase
VTRTPWLSWRLYFLTIPIDVIVLLLSSDHASTGSSDFSRWAILSLFAHGSIAPVVALALIFTSKFQSWKTDLAALIILGIVRGIAIDFGIGILGLEPKVSSVYKVFNSAISLPLWFIGIAVFVESRRHFQREFEAIFLRSVRKEQTSANEQNQYRVVVGDGELIQHLQAVASNLAREIEGVLSLPPSQVDYAKQTSKIQDLINKELRPASAQLWNGSTLTAPKLSFSTLLRISLFDQKLKAIAASLLFSPYIFIGLNGTLGWQLAAIETLLATSLNILIFMVCETLFKNGLLNRRFTNMAIMGSSYVTPFIVIVFLLPSNMFWTESLATVFFYQLFLTASHILILLGLNLYKLLGQQRAAVLESFEQIIKNGDVLPISSDDLNAVRDIDLARYLHGELQAGLIATSLLLQRASNTGDTDLARHALRSAANILRQDHARVSQSRITSPQARLEKISAGWRGIADVKIVIDWIDALETSVLNDVIALIDEGVSNAIRHAKASTITVSGSRVGADVHLEILSNGSGMTEQVPGLGTKLFNELTSSFEYSRQGELNLLKFTVRSAPLVEL